jgi:hypothetical protein
LARCLGQVGLDRPVFVCRTIGAVGCIAARRNIVEFECYDIAAT